MKIYARFVQKLDALAFVVVFVCVFSDGCLYAAETETPESGPEPEPAVEQLPSGNGMDEAAAIQDSAAAENPPAGKDAALTDFSTNEGKKAEEISSDEEKNNKDDTKKIVKNNSFPLAPLGLLIGGVSLGYQRGLAGLITLGVRAIYLPPLLLKAHVVGGDFDLYFWTRHPNNGFFVGPAFQVAKIIPKSGENKVNYAMVISGLVDLGYRWIWNNGFNIGLGGGLGWGIALADDNSCSAGSDCEDTFNGFAYRIIFDLGYAF